MMQNKKSKIAFGAVLMAVLAGVVLVWGGSGDRAEDMIFSWDAPTAGTPVVRYEVQIRVGGSQSNEYQNQVVTTNSVTFEVDWLKPYEVRVRGVDANDRIGPWSDWSLAEDRELEEPDFGTIPGE